MTPLEVVAVTSRSFSCHPVLRNEMLEAFPNARFNDQGLSLSGDALIEFLLGCEFAVTALETIDSALLGCLPDLRCIAKIGIGTDMIDLAAMDRHGVTLLVSPGTNANAVAELTVMLMLACLRRLPEAMEIVERGEWSQPKGRELRGRVVGIVGYGNVGKAVERLISAFGATSLVFDPLVVPEAHVSLEDLLAESDIVTLHVALSEATHHLINAGHLDLMGQNAILINTSRGGVVDEVALSQALRGERIAYAALDVLEDERSSRAGLPRDRGLLITPHIGGSTEEAILAMGRAAIKSLAAHSGCQRSPADVEY